MRARRGYASGIDVPTFDDFERPVAPAKRGRRSTVAKPLPWHLLDRAERASWNSRRDRARLEALKQQEKRHEKPEGSSH